jgi:hypothetical protein
MNRTTTVAAMVAALIAGTAPLTLLNMHEQKQREIVREAILEERREKAYYDCLDQSLAVNLNWVQWNSGAKKYYTTDGKEVTSRKIIEAYEGIIERCEKIREGEQG